MHRRVWVAGILGGILLFVWGSASHLVLGLGDAGMSPLPSEETIFPALKGALDSPGLYFFPGYSHREEMSREERQEEMRRWEAKVRQGPWGLLLYHPDGTAPMSPRQLFVQMGCDIARALLAAFLLACAAPRLPLYWQRVAFVALLGLIAWLSVNYPYWNWYGFPRTFTMAALADHLAGFLCCGLLQAWIVRPARE